MLSDLIVVGSKPAGNGKWGHADLAGNVWEWTLDCYAGYHITCNDCGSLADSSDRVFRGGDFYGDILLLRSATRTYGAPWFHSDLVGARCARTSL